MKTYKISKWSEYNEVLRLVKEELASCQIGEKTFHAKQLFRGHADSRWPLETTLERYSSSRWSMRKYSELIYRCAPQIESFTNKTWNLPDISDYMEEIRIAFGDLFIDLPYGKFWIYLRHHGFPSPLLDWTSSPYIAAFFAFESHVDAEEAAIYVFIEMPKGIKDFGDNMKLVHRIGPYVATAKRHSLQQSWYTLATETGSNDHTIISHEEITQERNKEQNVFAKIIIPRSERYAAMESLHQYNITNSSLFQSEDALMRTMAYQEIELRKL